MDDLVECGEVLRVLVLTVGWKRVEKRCRQGDHRLPKVRGVGRRSRSKGTKGVRLCELEPGGVQMSPRPSTSPLKGRFSSQTRKARGRQDRQWINVSLRTLLLFFFLSLRQVQARSFVDWSPRSRPACEPARSLIFRPLTFHLDPRPRPALLSPPPLPPSLPSIQHDPHPTARDPA